MPERWGWAALVALVALPLPVVLPGTRGLGPEHVWPLLWVVLAGAGAITVAVWRWSRPFAGLLAWMILRTLWGGLAWRSAQIVILVLVAGLLYLAAVRLRSTDEPWIVGGFLIAVAVNVALGLLNLAGIYPGLWVKDHTRGMPQGLLTHPNHWGLFVALALPFLPWVARRAWPVLLVAGGALVVTSRSVTAILVMLLAVAILLGPRVPAKRFLGAMTGCLVVGFLLLKMLAGFHPSWIVNLTGGRWPIWQFGAAQALETPLHGQGPGMWRMWALHPYGPIVAGVPPTAPAHLQTFEGQGPWASWWTEAHSEPLQVFFELGLVGVALGAWLVWQALSDAEIVWWHGADPLARAWVLVVLMAAVAMWWTTPFRVPALAAPILFALARCRARAVAA